MKLTMEIEWHNLLENPDDLPKNDNSIMVAFLKNDDFRVDGWYKWWYSEEEKKFYYDDNEGARIYSDDEELVEYNGQIAAWAEWPNFFGMRKTLNKEFLGKE